MSSSQFVSYHLYFTGALYSRVDDAVLLDVVQPVCRELRSEVLQFFFVRYADPLPHVRLRLRPMRANHVNALRAAARQTIHGVLGRSEHPSLRVGTVAVDYVPETERYGSGEALETAHAVFCESSRCALSLLRDGAGRADGVRLGVAIAVLAITLAVFIDSPRRLYDFIASYAAGSEARWKSRTKTDAVAADSSTPPVPSALASEVQRLMVEVQRGGRLPTPLQRYANGMKRARSRLALATDELPPECRASADGIVTHILPSYVHMMCNRIGLDPRAEGVAARMLVSITANGYAGEQRS